MDKYRVFTNGNVRIEGVSSSVQMFDVTGRMIESANTPGTFTSKAVKAGIYILKVDGATLKVMVN
jgi:hypothetical protein